VACRAAGRGFGLASHRAVDKNFGRTPAYGIRFECANPPTVGKYETAYEDRYVDIAPLNLPRRSPTGRRVINGRHRREMN
jgi:hypothetical protein